MLYRSVRQIEQLADTVLDVYLLPQTPWQEATRFQQRLVYELGAAPRRRAALVLCEHPPIITVGRQGSRRHIRLEEEELRARRLDVRWTNRGGGCWLHAPGQLVAYSIVPLAPPEFGLAAYRAALYRTLVDVLEDFRVAADWDTEHSGVCVRGREIASVGVAVKDWVTYHGCRLNVCVALDRLRKVQANPRVRREETCLFRELRSPVRVDAVRESFVRHFTEVFGFRAFHLLNPPPLSTQPARSAHVAPGRH